MVDVVRTSLNHCPGTTPGPATEAAEALDNLWAHTVPEDGLEHASARTGRGRLDLLLLLLPPEGPVAPDTTDRAAALVARSHRNSPVLTLRYLPPAPAPSASGH
ncbi:hypothetical protein ACIQ9P_31655 [Kitasatospora sp. NPDC094019]|uniref:hypothetical protein n=1 Tax=Kitasatospora sp. NPDC094019 TaxID=3364091 RepID=UPI00382D29A6